MKAQYKDWIILFKCKNNVWWQCLSQKKDKLLSPQKTCPKLCAMVVAELAEWSLPTPEINGSNPNIVNEIFGSYLSVICYPKKMKIKKKRSRMANFKKLAQNSYIHLFRSLTRCVAQFKETRALLGNFYDRTVWVSLLCQDFNIERHLFQILASSWSEKDPRFPVRTRRFEISHLRKGVLLILLLVNMFYKVFLTQIVPAKNFFLQNLHQNVLARSSSTGIRT